MLRATVCESHSKGSPFSIPDMAVMELMARVFFSFALFFVLFLLTTKNLFILFLITYVFYFNYFIFIYFTAAIFIYFTATIFT